MAYQFGPFLLNTESRLLVRDGEAVPITAKVLETLVILVQNRGKVMDKEELLHILWPDTMVEEANLTQNISTLRKALGDSPKDHLYIATIAGRGYQFVASVTEFGVGAIPGPKKTPLLRHWVAISLPSAIMVGTLTWVLWHPSRQAGLIEHKLTTNSPENSVKSAAVSPDARSIAYADNTGIYLKLIRNGETHAVSLPAEISCRVDDWFPDGSHLLVSCTEKPGRASMWSISLFGGSPRRLMDDASGGSVSPDGVHIAFRRGVLTSTSEWGREEWVMRSDGTNQIRVAASKPDGSQVGVPTWSPDCKRIAYIRSHWAYNARTSSVELNEWQKGSAETLFSDSRLSPALHWLADGRLIYGFGSAQQQQDSSLWVVAMREGKKVDSSPKRIAGGHGWISQVRGSADGRTVIFLRGNWLPSVYLGTLAPGGTRLLSTRRLTLDENENIPFSWTPDSKAVLFSSDRNGNRQVFKQAIDRPVAENLVASVDQLSQPRVSPDGSEILYISTPTSSHPDSVSSICAIPINGGIPRNVLKDFRIWNVQCARSPSNVCLYSITKGAKTETFQFDVRTGKTIRLQQAGTEWNWSLSPGGSERAIVASDANHERIQIRSISNVKVRDLVVEGWSGLTGVDWSADGKSLLVSWHNFERDSALLRVGLDGKAVVLLHSVDPEIWHAIPSPNGRYLAIAQVSGPKNVWQIENF